jgi:hypothetical protein
VVLVPPVGVGPVKLGQGLLGRLDRELTHPVDLGTQLGEVVAVGGGVDPCPEDPVGDLVNLLGDLVPGADPEIGALRPG